MLAVAQSLVQMEHRKDCLRDLSVVQRCVAGRRQIVVPLVIALAHQVLVWYSFHAMSHLLHSVTWVSLRGWVVEPIAFELLGEVI